MNWKLRACAASLIALGTAGMASADSELSAAIDKDYKENLGPLFQYFHQHPELSFLETETAKRLASELRALGYDVTEGVGGTGVVAVLKNGDGPTVLMRADMDGLPLKEDSGVAQPSTVTQVDIDGIEKPVMHACGHDVHITSLVGAARQMAERKQDWSGTLVLVGQPAEERIGGARAMIQDGLYERFPKPDYAIAFHVAADLETVAGAATPDRDRHRVGHSRRDSAAHRAGQAALLRESSAAGCVRTTRRFRARRPDTPVDEPGDRSIPLSARSGVG